MTARSDPPAQLLAVLERSRAHGFLGPGPVRFHVEHALDYVSVAAGQEPAAAVDLGSGGGVPGLVLAVMAWPDTTWLLLEAGDRRCRFLVDAVGTLGLGRRVHVHQARAEVAGHDDRLRGQADLVVARSFGPPAVTAECAAPLLRVGAMLVVSDPPTPSAERWPAGALGELGLERCPPSGAVDHHFAAFRQAAPCPDRFPRPIGRPAKRPLF